MCHETLSKREPVGFSPVHDKKNEENTRCGFGGLILYEIDVTFDAGDIFGWLVMVEPLQRTVLCTRI